MVGRRGARERWRMAGWKGVVGGLVMAVEAEVEGMPDAVGVGGLVALLALVDLVRFFVWNGSASSFL